MDIAMLEIILYKSNLILQAEGRMLCVPKITSTGKL